MSEIGEAVIARATAAVIAELERQDEESSGPFDMEAVARAASAAIMAAIREPKMIEKLALDVQCYHRTADDARYVLDALAGELFNV